MAASSMTEDVQSGADIFVFAQDQLSKLKTAGALAAITRDLKNAVVKESEKEAVDAASINGTMYAYPFTSDNGYFMYYDKRVVSDEEAKETNVPVLQKIRSLKQGADMRPNNEPCRRG